jgi:hypothetical protein
MPKGLRMPEGLRNHLASLMQSLRTRFGHVEGQDEGPEEEGWSLTAADELKVPLDARGANAQAPLAGRRHEIVIATAALLGVSTRETRDWIVARMRLSRDPAMHSLARALNRMWDSEQAGRRGAAERNLQIACLIHAEVLTLRATGAGEHDIRGRAADIVRERLMAANPDKSPALRRRLVEIYRENEPRVLEIWPEMEALLLTG